MSEVRAYVLGVNGVGSVSSGVSPVEKVDLRANESVSSHVIIVNSQLNSKRHTKTSGITGN